MIPDDENVPALSSFQFPVTVPAADPDAGTLISVVFSQDWQALVLGCLYQLFQDTTWDTTDDSALNLAQERVSNLIRQFQTPRDIMPTGAVIWHASNTVPDGYLQANGDAVSRTTYAGLFSVIGVTYGPGDSSTTFNLPDLRGRSPLGLGQQSGGSLFGLADTGGEETHTLTQTEMPSHSHSTGNSLLIATATPPPLDVLGPNPIPAATGNTGGDGPHNNLQPYLVLMPCIKT